MEERGELITNIFIYMRTGIVPEMSLILKMAFSSIKDTLDRDSQSYENKCKLNSENGKKGGRPRKADGYEFSEKTERFLEKAKKADKDKEEDKETEEDKDKDNDTDTEVEVEGYLNGFTRIATTTHIEKEIKDFLESKGVPPEYIEYVEMRAAYYSGVCGKDVGALVLEWWQSDRSNPRWGATKSKTHTSASPPPNNDVEAWLEARLKKTFGDGAG
jgi:hypothetical protein